MGESKRNAIEDGMDGKIHRMQHKANAQNSNMSVPATRDDKPKSIGAGAGEEDDESDDFATSSRLSSSAAAAAASAAAVAACAGGSSQVAIPTTPTIVMIKNTMAALQFADNHKCYKKEKNTS